MPERTGEEIREELLHKVSTKLTQEQALAVVEWLIEETGPGKAGRGIRDFLAGSLLSRASAGSEDAQRAFEMTMAARDKLGESKDDYSWYPPSEG